METKTFDARGMACPLPVVNAKKESEEMTNAVPLSFSLTMKLPSRTLPNLATAKALQSLLRKKQRKISP